MVSSFVVPNPTCSTSSDICEVTQEDMNKMFSRKHNSFGDHCKRLLRTKSKSFCQEVLYIYMLKYNVSPPKRHPCTCLNLTLIFSVHFLLHQKLQKYQTPFVWWLSQKGLVLRWMRQWKSSFILGLTSPADLHHIKTSWRCMQNSLRCQIRNRLRPLMTSKTLSFEQGLMLMQSWGLVKKK